ncbi:MAG: tetratricopeptide repeat protein [Gemmatimonadetes bacterium]|nr:tetratricopeptide repeat protein [Gemmatimonadota bacterium]
MDLHLEQLIARGRLAFQARDYEAALRDFRAVLDAHPTFADIRQLVGACLSLLGQPEAALEEFDRAIAVNSDYVEAHLGRAITLNELGREAEAAAAFEAAWRADRRDGGPFPATVAAVIANAHADVGDLYLEAGAPEEAAEQYRAALRLRPGFADIRDRLARALLLLGRLDEAEAELRAALEANPRFLAARLDLALVHYRTGRFEEAIRDCEIGLEQEPGNAQARAYLAMIHGRSAAHLADDRA